MDVWSLPLAAAPHAETAARKIISDPGYAIWQPHFSPDRRWIVFQAHSLSKDESTLFVVSAAGGPWTRISAGKWDDKPRWSPDGKTIYYVAFRGGFFNLWGVHFDSSRGLTVGKPFQITTFESPSLMIPNRIPLVDISLTQDKLVLPLEEVSGSIWILDNVDR